MYCTTTTAVWLVVVLITCVHSVHTTPPGKEISQELINPPGGVTVSGQLDRLGGCLWSEGPKGEWAHVRRVLKTGCWRARVLGWGVHL